MLLWVKSDYSWMFSLLKVSSLPNYLLEGKFFRLHNCITFNYENLLKRLLFALIASALIRPV